MLFDLDFEKESEDDEVTPMTPSFPLSLPRAEGPVFALDAVTIQRGVEASRLSPRRRIILPLHRAETDGVQRMLNFMHRRSYVRPHCHPKTENIETLAVLQGAMGFVLFETTGAVRATHRLEAGNAASCMVDIEPGVWHTLVPLADDTVILEIKRGPYDGPTDKAFAAWAPEEGAPEAVDYLRELEAIFAR